MDSAQLPLTPCASSTLWLPHAVIRSLVPERLDRIETCRASRGIVPEEQSDGRREAERQQDRIRRDARRPLKPIRDELTAAESGGKPEGPAGDRHQDRFEQKLA